MLKKKSNKNKKVSKRVWDCKEIEVKRYPIYVIFKAVQTCDRLSKKNELRLKLIQKELKKLQKESDNMFLKNNG